MEFPRNYFLFLYDFHLLLSNYDFHLFSLFHFVIVLLGLWTLLNIVCSIAGPVLMFLYPLYKSIVAMESKSKLDKQQCITYWIIYSYINFMEMVLQPILKWIPIWYPLKVIFMTWLVLLSKFNGANLLYERFLKHRIEKHLTDKAPHSVEFEMKKEEHERLIRQLELELEMEMELD